MADNPRQIEKLQQSVCIERAEILFGAFRLEIHYREFNTFRYLYRRGGGLVKEDLYNQTLEVLEFFVRYAGARFSAEEIHDRLWPNEVGKSNVEKHIGWIRKALDPDDDNRYIRNDRGDGYVFIMPTEVLIDETSHRKSLRFPLKDEMPFEEFFGIGTTSANAGLHRSAVVVQADDVMDIVKAMSTEAYVAVKDTRAHKARVWANYHDLKGAEAIVEYFEDFRLVAPEIYLSRHHRPEDSDLAQRAPFFVALGLGFTDRSTRAFSLCERWMGVSRTKDVGDAVAIHEALVITDRRGEEDAEEEGFRRAEDIPNFWIRVPQGWDESYLEKWHAWGRETDVRNNIPGCVQDYAIILRYTERIGNHKRLAFVVGGFTERGTELGAKFLVKNWHDLWKAYVDEKPDDGDFLILIEGPSDSERLDDWQENKSFAITPEIVFNAEIEGCEWTDRVAKRKQQKSKPSPRT